MPSLHPVPLLSLPNFTLRRDWEEEDRWVGVSFLPPFMPTEHHKGAGGGGNVFFWRFLFLSSSPHFRYFTHCYQLTSSLEARSFISSTEIARSELKSKKEKRSGTMDPILGPLPSMGTGLVSIQYSWHSPICLTDAFPQQTPWNRRIC